MRGLRGVVYLDWNSLPNLKHHALLFDRLYCSNLTELLSVDNMAQAPAHLVADYEFLREKEIIIDPVEFLPSSDALTEQNQAYLMDFVKAVQTAADLTDPAEIMQRLLSAKSLLEDLTARFLSAVITDKSGFQAAPICKSRLPASTPHNPDAVSSTHTVLAVALEALPVPDDQCSWQDILEFKDDLREKQWGFRRFLEALSTKHQTEAEIRDQLEWSLNEYTKAMNLHHIKASQSFVDVFVISPLELIENLVKFNWSKIAKGMLQVGKRKVELMEAETRAPGRECAYVFDARKKFGEM